MPEHEPLVTGSWIAKRWDIWQRDLLPADEFGEFVAHLGLGFWRHHISLLWRLGLLRADLVVCRRKLKTKGLIFIGQDEQGRSLFADERSAAVFITMEGQRRKTSRQVLNPSVRPLFHPFRFFVAYHLERVLRLNVGPAQSLFRPEAFHQLLDNHFAELSKWFTSGQADTALARWNDTVSLAILLEPLIHSRLSGWIRVRGDRDVASHERDVEDHWSEVRPFLEAIGLERIKESIQALGRAIASIEPNNELHALVRMATFDFRSSLRGEVGAAVLLGEAAEILRRSSEEIWGVSLPEEYELLNPWGGKAQLYGSDRLFDGNRKVVNEFLRSNGLDYGVDLRWYVEGATEAAALKCALRDYPSSRLEIINLSGQFVANAKKRVLAFMESLEQDLLSGVFSFVSHDGDSKDVVRTVDQAIKEDKISGGRFVSKPDFEFDNFELSELEAVLFEITPKRSRNAQFRVRLRNKIAGAGSGKSLIEAAQTLPELAHVEKGELWGERLMKFALDHPRCSDGGLRPVLQALEFVLRFRNVSFRGQYGKYCVDQSGRPVKRQRARYD